ncbi:MAG: sodium:solute symporter family protein [Sporomusa sp.]
MILAIAVIYYVVLIGAVGIITRKRTKSASDFVNASGGLSWVMVTFAFVLIPLGSGHTLSLWESAPALGASVMWWGIITGGVFLPLMMLWFGPWVRRTKLQTIPQILEKIFGTRYSRLWSACVVATWTGIGAAEVTATGTAIYGLSDGALPLFPWCILIALILIVLYVYFGGMLQMVWLNVVNSIVMLVGSYLGLFMLGTWLAANLGGWEGVQTIFDNMGQSQMLTNIDFSNTGMWTQIIIPVTVLHCAAGVVAQNMNSPFFAAESDKACRKGVFIGAGINALASIPWIVMALIVVADLSPGGTGLIMANVPENEIVKLAPITLALTALPRPIVAVMMISLLAATLSTGGATVLANANVLTNDIIKRAWRPNMDDKTNLKVTRLMILVSAALFAFPALSNAVVFPVFLWCFSFGIPVFVVYFMGLKFRSSKTAAWITTMVAFAVNFYWTFLTPTWSIGTMWELNMYPVTVVSVVLGVILSLAPLPGSRPGLLRKGQLYGSASTT